MSMTPEMSERLYTRITPLEDPAFAVEPAKTRSAAEEMRMKHSVHLTLRKQREWRDKLFRKVDKMRRDQEAKMEEDLANMFNPPRRRKPSITVPAQKKVQ